MGTYEVQTEGGTYQVETDESSPNPQLSDLPQNAVSNLGRVLNPKNIAEGLGEQIKTGAYDIPKEALQTMTQVAGNVATGNPIGETPMAKRASDIASTETIQHPKDWAIKNPIDAAMLAGSVVAPFFPGAEAVESGIGDISERASRLAQEQSVKSLEGAMGQVRQVGPEEARKLGQFALDKGIVSPTTPTTLGMERAIKSIRDTSGKAIGEARKAGDITGGSPNMPNLITKAQQELGPEYETGMRSGESGALKNAIDEMAKTNNPNFENLARKATEMNQYATKNKMLQPTGATTDIANLISRENNAALEKSLNPEQLSRYKQALNDYSSIEDINKFFQRKEVREIAGRGHGVINGLTKGVMDTIGHKTMAVVADKVSKIMASPAVAKVLPVLTKAAKSGPAELATIHQILLENDPDYKNATE